MAIKHSTTATKADEIGAEVNKDEWNADHTITLTSAEFNTANSDDSFGFLGDSQTWTGTNTLNSFKGTGAVTVTDILDEDAMGSDSATALATQQSIKAYIDSTGSGDALTANPLSQFAATTSLQLAGVISDETGTGLLVFGTSPTLITPALGVIASGDGTALTGVLKNIVEDTTPQLGGNMDGQGNDQTKMGTISLTEQAAANADVAADGQFWVKTATPNQAWFTKDDGTEQRLDIRPAWTYLIEKVGSDYYVHKFDGTTVSKNTDLFTAFVAVLDDKTETGKAIIEFTEGTFTFTTLNINLTDNDLTIRGQGIGLTTLEIDSSVGDVNLPLFNSI